MKTRPLDPVQDWGFFDPDVRPPDTDLALIRPLTEESACALWSELVASDPAQRHPMLLATNHWLKPRRIPHVDWHRAWREPRTDPDVIIALLDERLPWKPEDDTVFFWMREQAVTLPWACFRRTWRPFLFSDEAPFLINLRSPEVVCFGPDGGLGIGERPHAMNPLDPQTVEGV